MTEKDEVVFTEAFKELAAEGYFTRLEAEFMPEAKTKKVPRRKKSASHHAASRNLSVKKHTTLTDKKSP